MSARKMIAAVALATVLAASSQVSSFAQSDACTGGELSVSRISQMDCSARIPLPTPRSGESAASVAVATEPRVVPVYVETPGRVAGETRLVRLVGPRFLPDADETIDLRNGATSTGFVESALNSAISYLAFAGSNGFDRAEQDAAGISDGAQQTALLSRIVTAEQ